MEKKQIILYQKKAIQLKIFYGFFLIQSVLQCFSPENEGCANQAHPPTVRQFVS